MSENSESVLDMRGSIEKFQQEILRLPQWDAEKHTSHYFADGMYCRALFRPAGAKIVGKKHLKSHFYIVCCGTILVTDGDGSAKEVMGPCVIVSKPGAKRAVYAVTDALCLTVHRTDETDLEAVEADLVEPDETSPFITGNKLKQELLK